MAQHTRANVMVNNLHLIDTEPLYRGELKDLDGPFFEVVLEVLFRLFITKLKLEREGWRGTSGKALQITALQTVEGYCINS